MANIIYPKPDKRAQWIKSMNEAVKKGFMYEEELNLCLELDSMTEYLLKKIKSRIELFGIQFKGN